MSLADFVKTKDDATTGTAPKPGLASTAITPTVAPKTGLASYVTQRSPVTAAPTTVVPTPTPTQAAPIKPEDVFRKLDVIRGKDKPIEKITIWDRLSGKTRTPGTRQPTVAESFELEGKEAPEWVTRPEKEGLPALFGKTFWGTLRGNMKENFGEFMKQQAVRSEERRKREAREGATLFGFRTTAPRPYYAPTTPRGKAQLETQRLQEAADVKVTQIGEDIAREAREWTEQHPEFQKPEDIGTFLEGGYADPRWYAATLGSGTPQVLGSLGAMGAVTYTTKNPFAGFAAGASVMFPQEAGSAYKEYREDLIANGMPEEQAKVVAAEGAQTYGMVSAGLESMLGLKIFAGLSKSPAGQQLKRSIVSRVVASIGGNVAIEGSTEAMQETAMIAIGESLKTDTSAWLEVLSTIKDPESLARIIESGAAGGLLGMIGVPVEVMVDISAESSKEQAIENHYKAIQEETGLSTADSQAAAGLVFDSVQYVGEQRVAGLRPDEGRPGIDRPAPLPEIPAELVTEAKKFDSAEEFIESQPVKEEVLKGAMEHRPAKMGIASDMEINAPDFYTHPEYYDHGGKEYDESISVLNKIKDKPDSIVTIYRASPKNELRTGDWVTFSKEKGKMESLSENVPVQEFEVKVKELEFAGDDITEFGYWGHSTENKSQLTDIWNQAQKLEITEEQLLEAKGWKEGNRVKFDRAVLNKDADTVRAMLPNVPLEYQQRFSGEIEALLPDVKIEKVVPLEGRLPEQITPGEQRVGALRGPEDTGGLPKPKRNYVAGDLISLEEFKEINTASGEDVSLPYIKEAVGPYVILEVPIEQVDLKLREKPDEEKLEFYRGMDYGAIPPVPMGRVVEGKVETAAGTHRGLAMEEKGDTIKISVPEDQVADVRTALGIEEVPVPEGFEVPPPPVTEDIDALREEVANAKREFADIKTELSGIKRGMGAIAIGKTNRQILEELAETSPEARELAGRFDVAEKRLATAEKALKRVAPVEVVAPAKKEVAKVPTEKQQGVLEGQIKRKATAVTRKEIKELQNKVIKLLKELPLKDRAKFITVVRDTNTGKQLEKAFARITPKINLVREGEKLARSLATKRSRIAFIKKIGEFNQTVVNEIKKEVGLTKPISQAIDEQLDAVSSKLRERLGFKAARGFRPKIEGKGTPRPEITESMYKANQELSVGKGGLGESIKDAGANIKAGVGKLLVPISTRLENISPSLKYALRRFEFKLKQSVIADQKTALPYLEKTKEMSKNDFADFDLALKNGDTDKINEIVEKYDMKKEYEAVKVMLDKIYQRANSVGFDIGYRENYHPRQIKDSKGFLEYLSKKTEWGQFDEAIKRKETDLGRYLTMDEKANLINNLIRGYSGGQITLSKTGQMKERKLDFIDPDLNQFYKDSNAALMAYMSQVNEAIEARKFFGKEAKVDKKEDQFNNLDDSIGAYTTQLLAEQKITPAQENELSEILKARFGAMGTSGIVGIYKNLAYIDTMGSVYNAITQLGDLAFSMYAGGIGRTVAALPRAITGKSKISKEELGIDRIAVEFNDEKLSGRAVNAVFKATGLEAMDSVGKNTLINSVISKYQGIARKPDSKDYQQLRKDLTPIFEGETDQVFEDLRTGEITENVKLLAFNELLDFQPVALSEVPQQYLTGGNSRIFYMLKTWTLKMLDVYRREAFRTMKTNKVQGMRNLMKLSAMLIVMNGTADLLKDLILGKKIDLKDTAVDNMLKLIGFSRYSLTQSQRDGFGSTILEQIIPPTKTIDNISKDVGRLYKDFDENFAVNKLKSVESIPIGGKLYYWWFGKGAESPLKKDEGEFDFDFDFDFDLDFDFDFD